VLIVLSERSLRGGTPDAILVPARIVPSHALATIQGGARPSAAGGVYTENGGTRGLREPDAAISFCFPNPIANPPFRGPLRRSPGRSHSAGFAPAARSVPLRWLHAPPCIPFILLAARWPPSARRRRRGPELARPGPSPFIPAAARVAPSIPNTENPPVRRILLLTVLLAASALPAAAQRRGEVPRRPTLPAAADTNDARAYMALAEEKLTARPREAADAFYWAHQINPSLSDALYGRYTALLMTEPRRLVDYVDGNRRTLRQPEVVALDSLYFRALTMDPFLYRRFEANLFRFYLESSIRGELDSSGGHDISDAAVQRYVSELLMDASPAVRAREAYTRGLFPDALRLYEEAIRGSRRKSWLRTDRARLLAHMRDWQPALAEMTLALEERRQEDDRDVVYLYESKALLEHGIGLLNERLGNLDAAREAYARALTEEMTYYPAHVRLATLAMTAGDTASALASYDLASQTTNDPTVLYMYGALLAQGGKYDEAAAQFDRAIQSAPFYADPYFGLAMVRDAQGNGTAAAEAYRGFMARSTSTHRRREHAQQRIQALSATAAVAP
jgi:tetratricopeptide (TPR) repeat protein